MKIRHHAGSLDESKKTMETIPPTATAVREYFGLDPLQRIRQREISPDPRLEWAATYIIYGASLGVLGFSDEKYID